MISLFRVEVDEVLQRLLAYCAEFRRFVDAHTAVLHTAVNALQAVSGTFENTHLAHRLLLFFESGVGILVFLSIIFSHFPWKSARVVMFFSQGSTS